MKNQALFSSKDKSKQLKCRLLQFLFGALMVNWQGRTSLSIFLFVLFIPIIIFVLFLMCRINFVPLAREDDQHNSLSNCLIRFYLVFFFFFFFFIYLFDLYEKFICICGSRYVQRPTLHSNLDEIGGGRVVRRCWVSSSVRILRIGDQVPT